jgi:hypothetical protein
MRSDVLTWVYAGFMALVILGVLLFQLTPSARMRRRRRKSNAPVISTSRKPMVRLSVRPPKR